jgi:hypothetical protein
MIIGMIGPAQFVNGIWMGTVLIALGLVPELFQSLTVLLQKVIKASFPAPIPSRWRAQIEPVSPERQPLLTSLGAAIIVATFFFYFAK